MEAIPLPPSLPIPDSFDIPTPTLSLPRAKPLEWEPIPLYIEDVPIETPLPNPGGIPDDNVTDDVEDEEELEEEGPNEDKNKEETESVSEPPLDIVPEMAEVQTIEIPFVGIEVPVPRTEIIVVASSTAAVSSVTAVAGTLLATTLFRKLVSLLKPVFKTIAKKLAKARKKKPPLTFGRQRLLERRRYTERRKGNRE